MVKDLVSPVDYLDAVRTLEHEAKAQSHFNLKTDSGHAAFMTVLDKMHKFFEKSAVCDMFPFYGSMLLERLDALIDSIDKHSPMK